MDYNGTEELGTPAFGLGHYSYIGNIVRDGSAIYGQSENNPGGRSVILIDWQGPLNHLWIGTVIFFDPSFIFQSYYFNNLSPYDLLYLLYFQYLLENSVIWVLVEVGRQHG